MMIYVLFLGVLISMGIQFEKDIITFKEMRRHVFHTGVFFSIVILVLFAGLRNTRLGVDLWNYEHSFHWRSELSPKEVAASINSEKLYHLFAWLISQFTQNFSVFLMIVACLSIVPIGVYIQKYSENKWLSVWIYVCMGFYTFGFSALRQSIALGLTVIVLMLIEERKYWKAFVVLLLACGFHASAILCLPFFFFRCIKKSDTVIILILTMVITVFFLKDKILKIGFYILGREYDYVQTGGKIWYIALIVMVTVGILYKRVLWEDELGWHTFLILSAATVMMPICFSNPVLFRANYYYTIHLCMYVPNLLKIIRSEDKKWVEIVIVGITIFYFFHGALPSGHLESYKFVWQ